MEENLYNMKINKTIEAPFFFGASPHVFENARRLRNNMTQAEMALWKRLRKGQLSGLHFRRQHPINQFIADFYCHSLRLVIEVDGEIHKQFYQEERDQGRDAYMLEHQIRVLRFTNTQVIENIDEVINEIRKTIDSLPYLAHQPHPNPPQEGRDGKEHSALPLMGENERGGKKGEHTNKNPDEQNI
jgi:very-short-patch-repair endonuclease